jgi:hypothetical protein
VHRLDPRLAQAPLEAEVEVGGVDADEELRALGDKPVAEAGCGCRPASR